eukprot:scaffold175504_cov24-Tisochrysis_lutea.AAC.1
MAVEVACAERKGLRCGTGRGGVGIGRSAEEHARILAHGRTPFLPPSPCLPHTLSQPAGAGYAIPFEPPRAHMYPTLS